MTEPLLKEAYFHSYTTSNPTNDMSFVERSESFEGKDLKDDEIVTDTRESCPTGGEEDRTEPDELMKLTYKERFHIFIANILATMKTWHFWITIIHGQILSWCLVGTNTFTTYIADNGANMPSIQSLITYATLNVVFTPYTMYRIGFKGWFKMVVKDGWKFFLLAFADVQGNYFIVLAYNYTDLLSAQILDSWAICVVVILSFLCLKVRYRWIQILGIAVCIGGMVLVTVGDVIKGRNYAATDMGKGDAFVIVAATCYGISNTFEEFLVSKKPLYMVVGQLGFWAMIIMGVQAAIFDRATIAAANWNGKVGGYLVGYTLVMLIIYTTTPILFRMTSASFYNLSILTSDFWGLLIGLKLFGYKAYWIYYLGFVFTILGTVVYVLFPKNPKGDQYKPWLGEDQKKGIAGVGTARKKSESLSLEYSEDRKYDLETGEVDVVSLAVDEAPSSKSMK